MNLKDPSKGTILKCRDLLKEEEHLTSTMYRPTDLGLYLYSWDKVISNMPYLKHGFNIKGHCSDFPNFCWNLKSLMQWTCLNLYNSDVLKSLSKSFGTSRGQHSVTCVSLRACRNKCTKRQLANECQQQQITIFHWCSCAFLIVLCCHIFDPKRTCGILRRHPIYMVNKVSALCSAEEL